MPKPKAPSTRGRAPPSQAVSAAAERLGSERGTDSDGTMQSSDWMAERRVPEAPAEGAGAAAEGTPITSQKKDAARTGRARESRRGSY